MNYITLWARESRWGLEVFIQEFIPEFIQYLCLQFLHWFLQTFFLNPSEICPGFISEFHQRCPSCLQGFSQNLFQVFFFQKFFIKLVGITPELFQEVPPDISKEFVQLLRQRLLQNSSRKFLKKYSTSRGISWYSFKKSFRDFEKFPDL